MTKNYLVKSGNHNIDLFTNGVENPKKIILCQHGFNGNLWGDGFDKLREALTDMLVCSYDSAGHGNSEVTSLDMRLDLINRETFDVTNFLAKSYPEIPIIIFSGSYGSYRTVSAIANYKLSNVRHIILINPAFQMLNILEKVKEFDYFKLTENDTVPMKQSLNKYLSKKFLDDLYQNDILSLQIPPIPMTMFLGKNDNFVPQQASLEFAKMHNIPVKYIDDEHCISKEENWQLIFDYLRNL